MFETYSDANKQTDSEELVSYSTEPTFKSGELTPLYWTVRRRSTQSYHYYGMTQAAAVSAVASIRRDLTRSYAKWRVNEVTTAAGAVEAEVVYAYVLECKSSVTATHTAGSMWQVDVRINDEDEVVSLNELKTVDEIEQFFGEAISRNTSGASIAITSAAWRSNESKIYVKFSARGIAQFDASKLAAQTEESGVWTAATLSGITSTGCTLNGITANKKLRLTYDSTVISRPWTTTDALQVSLSLTAVKVEQHYESFTTGVSVPLTYPYFELSVGCSAYPEPSKMKVRVNGEPLSLVKVASLGGSSYRVTGRGDGALRTIDYASPIQVIIDLAVAPAVRASLTVSPANYARIEEMTWDFGFPVAKFVTDQPDCVVEQYFKLYANGCNSSGETQIGRTGLVKDQDGRWTFTGGEYRPQIATVALPQFYLKCDQPNVPGILCCAYPESPSVQNVKTIAVDYNSALNTASLAFQVTGITGYATSDLKVQKLNGTVWAEAADYTIESTTAATVRDLSVGDELRMVYDDDSGALVAGNSVKIAI